MNIANKMYDKKFRSNLINDPKKYIQELGDSLSDELDIIVKENTKDTTYVVVPSSNVGDSLGQIQAAGVGCAGSSGTLTSASTYGTASSTLSTLGSLISVATAGTAK